MVLDIFVVALFLIALIIGYKYGGASTILSSVGIIASIVLAVMVGHVLSAIIYDAYVSPSIVDNVAEYAENVEKVAVSSTVESLPGFAKTIVNLTGFDSNESFVAAITSHNKNIAISVETALEPLLVMVVTMISSLVLFVVFYLIFRLFLFKPVSALFETRFIARIDKYLGLITSFIGAFVLVSILAFILKLLNPVVDDMPSLFSEATIYKSYIFSWFYNGNIFNALTSLL